MRDFFVKYQFNHILAFLKLLLHIGYFQNLGFNFKKGCFQKMLDLSFEYTFFEIVFRREKFVVVFGKEYFEKSLCCESDWYLDQNLVKFEPIFRLIVKFRLEQNAWFNQIFVGSNCTCLKDLFVITTPLRYYFCF